LNCAWQADDAAMSMTAVKAHLINSLHIDLNAVLRKVTVFACQIHVL
jgi:hypothetical protein